jgi:hypothetical protein
MLSHHLKVSIAILGSAMDLFSIFTAPISPTPLLPAAINVTTQLSVVSPLKIRRKGYPKLRWGSDQHRNPKQRMDDPGVPQTN